MISHVIECSCQYSDQIRKKHKIWHDGKLKYYQVNSRFMLYPEDSNVLIASNFISNQREVSRILDTEGFNTVEHKIFSRAVVIITDILCEYDREIQLQKAEQSQNVSMKHKGSIDSDSNLQNRKNNPSNSYPASERLPQKILRKRILISENEGRTVGNGKVSLALKFNKPFKPPTVVNEHSREEIPKHRPAKRSTRAQGNITDVNHTMSKIKEDDKTEREMVHISDNLSLGNRRKTMMDLNFRTKTQSVTKSTSGIRRERNFKRKHISHTPINI